MLVRSSGRSGQRCRSCITRAKSAPEGALVMPVTSCTSGERACLADAAIRERQKDTKNCSNKTTEQTRMRAAIIGAPPPAAKGQGEFLQELARWRKPTPRAGDNQ